MEVWSRLNNLRWSTVVTQCCDVEVSTVHVRLWCLFRKWWLDFFSVLIAKRYKKIFYSSVLERNIVKCTCFRCLYKEMAERVAMNLGELSLLISVCLTWPPFARCPEQWSDLMTITLSQFAHVWDEHGCHFLSCLICWRCLLAPGFTARCIHFTEQWSGSDLQPSVWPNQ